MEVWQTSNLRRLKLGEEKKERKKKKKTAEKNSAQTNKQTNRHYENNGHLAVNKYMRLKGNSCIYFEYEVYLLNYTMEIKKI